LESSGKLNPDPPVPPFSNSPAAGFQLGYRRWLDGLRGVAILSVLAFHLRLLPGGSLGVDIFFVLSGFLITALLAEEWQRYGSISLKAFYLRRGLRLLPAFLTLLVILGASSVWMQSADEARALRAEVMVACGYIANWPALHGTGMPALGHTWSLSVEEQFYLLWPVILYGMVRLKLTRRQILMVICAGILVSASLRMTLYDLHRTAGPEKAAYLLRLYMGLDTRADSLLVGCLVGLLVSWDLLPRSRRFVNWANIASVVSVVSLSYLAWKRCLDHSQYYHGLFTAVALMVGVIIVRMVSSPSRVGSLLLESTVLVSIGRISYGLYLYHLPITYWLDPAGLGWQHPAMTLLVVGLTFAAALLSFYCIEGPCLRLKDRLCRRAPIVPANVILQPEVSRPGVNRFRTAA
jgi:peptidoglycan/LPS O-acetylase OafA/YrhL